ncbi:unnamed protein product [Urochloa decumbens]|uniref:Rx N-terminal domain-containing protein n=1 Tax=Urochloa decumbens TaxID=240449 RepID=A0ABC9AI44_9POAL
MDAQDALDSLLGRLTSILVDEAQLLGRVRGDVEFIKGEMECMNSLILQLTEAHHRDYLVRAWMKQVIGLTRDCVGNVELYIHYIGSGPGGDSLVGYLRRVVRFVRTVQVRHRIATRIQELKARARDVGDRRQRYGVTVPPTSPMAAADIYDGDVERASDEEDLRRRAVLFDDAEPPEDYEEAVQKYIDTLVKCLSREPPPAAAAKDSDEPQVRVFSITRSDYWDCSLYENYLASPVARGAYEHPSVSTLFDCKALVKVFSYKEKDIARTVLAKILGEITGVQPGREDEQSTEKSSVDKDEEELSSELQGHLKGKRFLFVIIDKRSSKEQWKRILDALLHAADGCHPGSAIIVTTKSPSPYKIINAISLEEFYQEKIFELGQRYKDNVQRDMYTKIRNATIYSSAFARKMFMHLVYVNPIMKEDELRNYCHAISKCQQLNNSGIPQKMVIFCYNELPSKYRSCLLYLSIFPQGHVIKTTSLARRWMAEGIVTATTRSDEAKCAVNEAEHYWDELLVRGFISPIEISAAGNIKSCTLHHEVHKVITKIARDVIIVDTNLPTDWAHHLSIHNRIGLQKSHSAGDTKDFASSLPSLAASPEWKLLKVLDLEGCHGLEKHHLKSICKILLLKYLSLRNTDVTELPKQIKELQCLETLDIRQTKVRVLGNKLIVLPLLKHFLAGQKVSASNDASTSEESIVTVSMPLGIQKMINMEILSHVQITDRDSELAGITQLLKLRKLGVALQGKNVKLSDLFFQIEKLQKCLRSLSIRMCGSPAGSENHDAEAVEALRFLPQFIERLNICGITSRLVYSIKDHHQLAKITLSDTYLKEDDLRILGNLASLCSLKLQHKSYIESELYFKKCEFQSLAYLLVEGKEITRIRFAIGAAPKLERILWTFETMDALSGIDWLPRLKKLELNGDCDLDPIKEALESHPTSQRQLHE